MVVRGRSLVDNASQRLFLEGIDHGCLQAGHWNYKPQHPLQICSIDTLYRRKLIPTADLVVIDEAHYAVSNSFKWLVAQYPNAFILGVTATPHVKTGLRHIADHIVYPITISELITQGYLVGPRYFVPSRVDLSEVRTDKRTGDYNLADLSKAYEDQVKIFGDVVGAYKKHLNGAPSLLFAINKEHSRHLCELFLKEGFNAVHVEDSTPMSERQEVMRKLETGEINVVCNVGIFCVGVDIPCVRGIISVRPTQSYNLYVQQMGRGTRPYPGKEHFIILDHANNIEKHGFIEYEKDCDLDGKEVKRLGLPQPIICEQCFGASLEKICPHCGHCNQRVAAERESNMTIDITKVLLEVKADDQFQNDLDQLIERANRRQYKPGFVFHKIKEKYGDVQAKKHWKLIKDRVARQADERSNIGN